MRAGRGAALPAAVLAVLAFAVVIAGSYGLMRVQVRETSYQVRQAQAQAIAEAGLEDALNKVMLASNWKTGYPQKNFAGGYYTVSVSTDLAPWITSTGYSASIPIMGRAARTVKAQALFDGLFNFANSTFTVNWRMMGFDSSVDRTPTCRITTTIPGSGCVFGAHVAANATVATSGSALRIQGDALYATAASTAPAASTVAGKVSLAPSSYTVLVEDGAPYLTQNDNNASRINPFSAYNPATMILSVNPTTGDVALSSGTYYFKGINVTSKTLNINLSSKDYAVSIYLAGNLFVSPDGQIDSSNYCTTNGGGCKAYNVHIYGQGGGSMTLSGYNAVGNQDNITYLDLYAPRDNVVINQRMLGRAVGENVKILNPYGGGNNRPVFFFDLQFGFTQSTGVRWVSGSWSESYFRP